MFTTKYHACLLIVVAFSCCLQAASGAVFKNKYVIRQPQIHYSTEENRVVEDSKDSVVLIGGNITTYTSITLLCNATGYPQPVIRWKIKLATYTKRISNQGNRLVIPYKLRNSGEYICKAKNFLGNVKKSTFVKFLETVKPSIMASKQKISAINGENRVYIKIGADLTTIAGTEIDIHCSPEGKPPPKIQWYYNGKHCQQSHLDDLNYYYNKAIPSNATGNYTCVARNPLGEVNVTSQVIVIDSVYPSINGSNTNTLYFDMTRPLIKVIGGKIEALVGVSITLDCPVNGFPLPRIKWLKDNIPVTTGKHIRIKDDRLILLGTMKSDTGWYSCMAFNGAGSAKEATFLQLLAPVKPLIREAKYRGRPYIYNVLPTPLKANIGIELRILAHRKVTIYCTVSGFPRPKIRWLKNNKPLIYNGTHIQVSPSGQRLIFNNLQMDQSATYTCVASNAVGYDIARSRIVALMPLRPKLNITTSVVNTYTLSSPQSSYPTAKLAYLASHRQKRHGIDVVLECVAYQGYPRSTFTWYKDDRRLNSRTKEWVNKSRLIIRDFSPSDQGTYKCCADNIISRNHKSIDVFYSDMLHQ